jgi:hypothetical protein
MAEKSAVTTFVEVTSSVASPVEIIAAMIGWYLTARRPLKISGVVVHRSTSELAFIVVVKNRKDYPVLMSIASLEGKYEYDSAWKDRLRYLMELIRSIWN